MFISLKAIADPQRGGYARRYDGGRRGHDTAAVTIVASGAERLSSTACAAHRNPACPARARA